LPDKTTDEKMALKRDEMKKIHFLLLDPNSAEEED
jgi:heptaprenylglyceryl phosphate synthase